MNTETSRDRLPVLGIVGINYLRETGVIQLRQDVRVCYFGPPTSALHRMADYSAPIQSLDISERELEEAVRSVESRGIQLNGIVSFRDLNVPMVAQIAKRRKLPGPLPETLVPIQKKSAFRRFINARLSKRLHTVVQAVPLPKQTLKADFDRIVGGLLKTGKVIIKPDRGSCSYHITSVEPDGDLSEAWLRFKMGASFRGGDFIVEQKLEGQEFAVETILDERIRDMRITQYLPSEIGRFHETGHFVPDEFSFSQRKDIFRVVSEVHSVLGLKHMVTHMEFILPSSGLPGIVELNPRLAGDLTQELHRLISGIEYYRISARIATGQSVSKTLFGGEGKQAHALIKFHSPSKGGFTVKHWPITELKDAEDKFGLVELDPDALGDTNDDRPGYALLFGNDRRELERRATRLLKRIHAC